jgi:CO dehydrogenase maturation factor
MLILDMYAGVEHLGRATVDFVDAMIIVVEPTRRPGHGRSDKKAGQRYRPEAFVAGGQQSARRGRSAILWKRESPGMPVLGSAARRSGVQEADRLGICRCTIMCHALRLAAGMAEKLASS